MFPNNSSLLLKQMGIINMKSDIRDTKMKKILITGSTGYCGQVLIQKLAEKGKFEISVLSTDVAKAQSLFSKKVSNYYMHNDLTNNNIPINEMDVLFHLGFARPYLGNAAIAKSLQFTFELYSKAVENNIKSIVNISSRSVYGADSTLPWNEHTPVNPSTVYGRAKLATELLLQTLTADQSKTIGTSIRLGTVMGGSSGLVDVFVLSKFVKQAINGEPIRIIGGDQQFDILDIQDVVDAFIALINITPEKWKPIYNLSSQSTYNIVDMAQSAVRIASRFNGGLVSSIQIEKAETSLKYLVDSSCFYRDLNWLPKVNQLDNIVESLVKYYLR